MITRRGFLGASVVGVGVGVGAFGTRAIAQGASASGGGDPSRRVLVVVQLSGGNDALNTLVPWSDDAYHAARPKLRIEEKDVLKLDERVGLHPSLKKVRARFDRGQVAVVQGVGYTPADRSHFRSMAIWHAGEVLDGVARTGWIGRELDRLDPDGGDAALAVSLSNPVPFALRRGVGTVMAFENEEGVSLAGDRRFAQGKAAQVEAFRRLCVGSGGGTGHAARVREAVASGVVGAEKLVDAVRSGRSSSEYPRGIGARLGQVARMIDGGYGARVYCVSGGGWDTHARQKDAHAGLLAGVGDAVEVFLGDVERAGRGGEVVVMVFSEFGRRLVENGSAGTDHGTGGVVFVAGGMVKGGVVGRAMRLGEVVDGDPVATVDFREVYRGVAGWVFGGAGGGLEVGV